jgi:hypothetical protein
MVTAVLGGAVLVATHRAQAAAQQVQETDPLAVALGYQPSATTVNKDKYLKYAAGQKCSACALFQGKPGEAYGPCALYVGKVVNADGWCSAYAKKGA